MLSMPASRTSGTATAHADKYKTSGQPIYLIGVEFSKQSRNIVGFDVEQV
jgi:hypothetical protein